MKQTKQVKKEKDNYLKSTFLFPVVISVLDLMLIGSALYISGLNAQTVGNIRIARFILQAATIVMATSPTFLLITVYMSLRHVKKYPNGSSFYKKLPMLISLLVWGVQTLYSFGLAGI